MHEPVPLLRKQLDLSKSRPTPCQCSKILSRPNNPLSQTPDIRSFFQNTTPVNNFPTQRFQLYTSRDELIRGAHDRAKNRKGTHNVRI